MGQFFQSRNSQVPFAAATGITRLGSVQYSGPSIRSAVIVWDARLDKLVPTPINQVLMCLRTGPPDGQMIFDKFELVSVTGQTFGRVSGVAIADLEPGQVLDLVGTVDDPGAMALAVDGLKVWVL